MQPARDTDLRVFAVVLYYCLFIIISPVVLFFSSKYVFDNWFGLSNVSSNIGAAFCAVVMLHVALGLYIFKAYSRPSETPEKPAKQD